MFKKNINQSMKHLSYFLRNEKSFAQPTIFQLESTNHCPMTCIMCPRTKHMTRELGFIDVDLYMKIVNELGGYVNKTGYLRLHHFGDPLVHPQIDKLISYVGKKGLKVSISVNPILLSDKIINKILDSGLDQIQISLDGVDDESYRKIRGRAANYRLAEDNIKNLIKARSERQSKNPKILVGMVLMDATETLIKRFKYKWEREGADEVIVKSFSAFGNEDLLDLGDEQGKKHIKEYALKYPCYWPWRNVVVLWDGKVVPCCWDYDGKYVLGDLRKQSLKDIWNGDAMRKLRRQHISGDFADNDLCRNCVERYGAPGIDSPINLLKFTLNKLLRRKPI